MKPTLSHVASEAGVSKATVSKILNGTDEAENFAEPTRRRVHQAARQLGYRPRQRRTASRRPRLVSFLHPRDLTTFDMKATYDGEILSTIIEQGNDRHWHISLTSGMADTARAINYIDRCMDEQVDGLVLCGNLDASVIDHVAKVHAPAVYICDTTSIYDQVHGVYADNFQGGRLAARHLMDLGHQRFICVRTEGREYQLQRIDGFREQVRRQGFDEEHVQTCTFESLERGHAELDRLLAMKKPATALFITAGDVVPDVYAYIHKRKIGIPGQLSMIGYDDYPLNESIRPPLTTVANSRRNIGTVAFKKLLEVIEDPRLPPTTTLVPSNLVTRESTGELLNTS